jgi:uncharacterized protein (DUF1778 family)
MAHSERIEFRVRPDAKRMIAEAARVLGMDTSDFARDVLLERAGEVLAEHEVKTVVPAAYFDDLVASLEQPTGPNDALRDALASARRTIRADHLQA